MVITESLPLPLESALGFHQHIVTCHILPIGHLSLLILAISSSTSKLSGIIILFLIQLLEFHNMGKNVF